MVVVNEGEETIDDEMARLFDVDTTPRKEKMLESRDDVGQERMFRSIRRKSTAA